MFNKVLCLLFLLNNIGNLFCLSDELPEVETSLGKILGVWGTSDGGRTYAAFEGIPFAKPPVGDLRFEDPQPIEPWKEVLNATRTYTCPQTPPYSEGFEGTEDCLYLNVYVPIVQKIPEKGLDVLVSIHGGSFNSGSGHSMVDSNIIMDGDLILVSINYRLGVLGFLSAEDAVLPGNYGMKDQALALKWVKDNIASFAGNPDAVTIAGLSAGGASVHLHYFSPMSKGLFVRGLSQSGTALDPWTIQRNALENTQNLAALLRCSYNSTVELKNCLKEKSAIIFLAAASQLSELITFTPVIEKDSANPFLTRDPYLLLKEKQVHDLPWITSNTADDGLIISGPEYTHLEQVDQNWLDIADDFLEYSKTLPASKRKEVAEEIRDFYLGSGEHFNQNNFKKFTQMTTDRYFAVGAEVAAKLQAIANKSPVYYYFFNYQEGENSLTQIYLNNPDVKGVKGVAHGDDMLYFYTTHFYTIVYFDTWSENDLALRNASQNMLYSYVTTGKPSFDGTDDWQPTSGLELTYLNVTGPENIKLHTTKDLSHSEFWKELGLSEVEDQVFKGEI